MPKTTYDPKLRESEHGVRLYGAWKRMRQEAAVDPSWCAYPAFYTWAMDIGYVLGDKLMRHDESLPYSPENCFWVAPLSHEELWARNWCKKWDDTISKLRRQLGLPPLEGGK